MKNILEYKSLKVEADRLKISEVLIKELLKFNFEEDYLKEGDLQIENASEITFNSCVIENYTETRSISESNRPNRSGVPPGSKRISEFNVWDYKLSFDKEFQNSTDHHDILESHHAIGCGTCKQQGKIRCSSCRGAGDVTCSSCNGRGEKQCGNCNGKVDIKCWSCSGKGTKETGYGENKRTERCSSCSGRGSNKCTRCSNGFITCSTCSGNGKVTCYTCHGSGEVTCYQCDGNRTMDHFFIVSASFINLSQTLYLTNPYPGFDQNKSKTTNFNIQSKLFDIKEPRFKESHFNDIKSSPFYRQITSFLDFTNNDRTKLIASRITCFENKYFEVTFNFYGEKYTLFLDKNFENSYYNGKKPSDQYELDLLKKSLESSVKNDLKITNKTIEQLSRYDFIDISEKEIINAIEDTEKIYQAYAEFKNKKYSSSEKKIKSVSDIKKREADYISLKSKLKRKYVLNTLFICGLLYFGFHFININLTDNDFIQKNIIISIIGFLVLMYYVPRTKYKTSIYLPIIVISFHALIAIWWYNIRIPSQQEIKMACACTDNDAWVYSSNLNGDFDNLPQRVKSLRRECHPLFERGEFKFEVDAMQSRERDAHERAIWVCENFSKNLMNGEGNKSINIVAKYDTEEEFKVFKADKDVIYLKLSSQKPGSINISVPDSIIIIEKTGKYKKRFFIEKGSTYKSYENYVFREGKLVGMGSYTDKKAQERKYLDLSEEKYNQLSKRKTIPVPSFPFGVEIEIRFKDINFNDDETEIEISYMKNNINDFKANRINKTYIKESDFKFLKVIDENPKTNYEEDSGEVKTKSQYEREKEELFKTLSKHNNN